MSEYKVKDGDTLTRIANMNGFSVETIWNHSKNKELKGKRKDPDILFVGDIVFIPGKGIKKEDCVLNKINKYHKKDTHNNFQVMLLDGEDKPRKNLEYIIQAEDRFYKGKTDSEGKTEQHLIPSFVEKVVLTIKSKNKDEIEEEYVFNIGHLDPVDTIQGIQQRLNHLGYNCGDSDGDCGEFTSLALSRFQADNDIEPDGNISDETKNKLTELVGM